MGVCHNSFSYILSLTKGNQQLSDQSKCQLIIRPLFFDALSESPFDFFFGYISIIKILNSANAPDVNQEIVHN